MSYNFNEIEAKWQEYWAKNQTFKVANDSEKPKFYGLDMFPYPSGAGLHVGHPLGYIASDIVARYKRHQGFNVLHPQGYDSFGLPAEQYAIQTGQHPADTTQVNIEGGVDKTGNEIAGYRRQLDKIGFSFDWSREVRTSDPAYYKWTQWIFIQLFESWYDVSEDKARPISELTAIFSTEGNATINAACDEEIIKFSAEEWKNYSEEEQQQIILKYRLTYLAETEVNWCPQLGTVLANDEIVNGVSERGGHPVVRKKMKQWSMRISAYAERLLNGLENLDWTESLKETQRNWIGKSKGASVLFKVLPSGEDLGGDELELSKDANSSHPQPFPEGRKQKHPEETPGEDLGGDEPKFSKDANSSYPQPFPEGREQKHQDENYKRLTGNPEISGTLLNRAKEMRNNPTEAEALLWKELKGKKLDFKFRQQHPIDNYIVDFVCLSKKLIIEIDGEIHKFQDEKDSERQLKLEQKLGYKVLRFSNEKVINNISEVLYEITKHLKVLPSGEDLGGDETEFSKGANSFHPQPFPEGREQGISFSVFTTRPDTIFGTTFMTLAPEHELVSEITTAEQKEAVEAYQASTAKRSERERMADVKTISGVFTGGYAEHPFTKEPIPIWIGDYVLAGYGTGAVMAVPCGDQRDYDFAKHFEGEKGMPGIKNIFKDVDISEGAHADKNGTVLTDSDFLNDLPYKKAMKRVIFELEKIEQGEGKTNYRLRDAVFSRQRYWGEPFPVYYVNNLPQMIDTKHLPIRLPEVEKYLPTAEGEPPLGRADVWAWDTEKNEVVDNELIDDKTVFSLELNTMPGWAGSSWYFFRYMEAAGKEGKRDQVFASSEAMKYWQNVDLYIGGSEHGTGHLLYARFWTKFLKDRGLVPVEEPFKKLINQGMIMGESAFVYRIDINLDIEGMDWDLTNLNKKVYDEMYSNRMFISYKTLEPFISQEKKRLDGKLYDNVFKVLSKRFSSEFNERLKKTNFKPKLNIKSKFIQPIHADVTLVNTSNELDIEGFKNWREEFKEAEFILDNGKIYDSNSPSSGGGKGEDGDSFTVGREVEKMSKSKYNVVNPDDICEEYGADTLRMYEMFLGPIDQAKPWNTAGITGVHNFLKKLWKLYHSSPNPSEGGEPVFTVSEEPASKEALKTLHKTIKKVTEDIEDFSFNTSVSTFMICVNELSAQKCNSREVLEPLTVLIAPYAPHIAEELWSKLGNKESVAFAAYPVFKEKCLKEDSKTYPISFNGKMRFTMDLSLDLSKDEIEKIVMDDERTRKQLDGREPKKVIIVPGKIVNIVG